MRGVLARARALFPHGIPALRSPFNVLVLGLLVAVASFYLWTATSSGNPIHFGESRTDYYNVLGDGFLDGQLSLPVKPAKELLALPNPYDPVANGPYRLHDLSLYKGRYYMPWGPTPALTLFLPFRLLGLGDMPENLAVVLFSLGGLVFSILLLRLLVRRFLPTTPLWVQLAAIVALAFENVAPFILRRPAVYEVAISAGYCFTFAGLYLLFTGVLTERRSLLRLALGSLCLGLAVGARPNLLLVALVLVFVWRLARRGALRAIRVRVAAALIGPLLLCVAALVLYNYARFHSPLEFGQRYQLAGVEVRKKDTFNPSYIVPGLYYYLFAPARLNLNFPFFHLPPPPAYPGHVPAGYDGVEVTGGLFPNVPILLVLPAVVPFVFARRLKLPSGLGAIVGTLTLIGAAIVLALSFAFWGTTMRYEMDFLALLLLAALLVWLAAVSAVGKSRSVRRLFSVGGAVLVGYGALVGAAISVTGYYDSLRTGSPGTYRTLERFFSPLPTLATMIIGRPILVDVVNPTGYSAPINYGTAGAGAASFWIGRDPAVLEIVAPRDGEVVLEGVLRTGPSAAAGSGLIIVATSLSRKDSAERAVRDRVGRIPVLVNRGLNEVRLRVIETPPPRPTPSGAAPEQVAAVEGLHVTGWRDRPSASRTATLLDSVGGRP
jgi:hypothetical protein